ncbi:MAG: 6-phosphogluconolactonase, partial [Actinomycetota bacterium]
MDVVIADDAAERAAEFIRSIVQGVDGPAAIAVSGGSTAPAMLAALRLDELPTPVGVWQVDERVAPAGSADRNAEQLAGLTAAVTPLRVDEVVAGATLVSAAAASSTDLPPRFDVVHLGLGDDGHTASWPPSPHPDAGLVDAVSSSVKVVPINDFNGFDRLTLTPAVVEAATHRVVLVTGSSKAEVVRRWLDEGDPALPVARLATVNTTVFLDPSAASLLPAVRDATADPLDVLA